MKTGDRSPRGPSVAGVLLLAACAAALLATSPGLPAARATAIGQVVVDGGASVERRLHVHLADVGQPPSRGTVTVQAQAASGLAEAYGGVEVSVAPTQAAAAGSVAEACAKGCDLDYTVRVTAGGDLPPASLVRYEVDVEFQYAAYGSISADTLRLELEGTAEGPVAPLWSILAGLIALAAGIGAGPRVDRALGPRRRRWPAVGLVLLTVLPIARILATTLPFIALYGPAVLRRPLALIALFSPWSCAILLVLAWGVWSGIRRWDGDGGRRLGLAAVAAVGLGGLWLAYALTASSSIQPILLTVPFLALGGLGGVVIGQAWRLDQRAQRDRGWAAVAVLANGVLIAGFGFQAAQGLNDPIRDGNPLALLLVLPALLVAAALRAWLGGRRAWLVAFDLLVMLVGLLGLFLWNSGGSLRTPQGIGLADVAVDIAVAASVVAFAASLHRMPRAAGRNGPADGDQTLANLSRASEGDPEPPERHVDGPQTT